MTPPPQPFVFGYFPRHKYKDLVFYVETGEYSNMGLFEMEDTEENRALMDALSTQSSRDKVLKTLQKLKGYMEAWRRANLDLNEIEKGENIVLNCYIFYLERKIEELRQAGAP